MSFHNLQTVHKYFLYLKVVSEQIEIIYKSPFCFDLIQEFRSFGKYVVFGQVIKIENLYHFYNVSEAQLFGDTNWSRRRKIILMEFYLNGSENHLIREFKKSDKSVKHGFLSI